MRIYKLTLAIMALLATAAARPNGGHHNRGELNEHFRGRWGEHGNYTRGNCKTEGCPEGKKCLEFGVCIDALPNDN